MMQKMRLADRKTLRDLRCDFFNAFLIMRNQMIRNQTQKMEEKEEVKNSNVHTKLNQNVLTFTKAIHELPRRNQHNIIQNVAKEKKQ